MIRCDEADQVASAFAEIEAGLGDGLHAAGFLAYELGYALEPRLLPLMPAAGADPLIWMGLFDAPSLVPADVLDAGMAALPPPGPLTGIEAGHDRTTHAAKVRDILELIGAGDIYQANLTFPIHFHSDGPPLGLYAVLRTRQPTSHSGVVALGGEWVLSVSPELFLRGEDGDIESRPMKGTAPRGMDAAGDRHAVQRLLADPKQRAENLMITDLIRNDLARISEPGTVRVPHLFTAETYPSFHTLTSTVTARLRPGVSLAERVAAVFPCGSIVGAPKIRAAEVLAKLEAGPRGVYTGAIGAFSPDGGLDLNVAIRTAVLRADGRGAYGVGGGVVADSDPGGEYDEARLKGRLIEDLARDFGLIETFCWSRSKGFVRLARHLDRLDASARILAFPFDLTAAEQTLALRARDWTARGVADRRVRLSLSRTGVLSIQDADAPSPDDGPVTIGLATVRLDAADPFLKHKTTRREIYDAAAADADAFGWADALILNRSGAVADGARHTLFAELDGRLLTPPLTAGSLPGVLRGELLAAGHAAEGSLTPADLQRADRLFIGNSLRGLRPARSA